MKFQNLLIETMRKKKISALKLQSLSGVPDSSINYYIRGGLPTVETASKLLKALGVSMTIGEEKEKS